MTIDPQTLISLYQFKQHPDVCLWFENGIPKSRFQLFEGEKYRIYFPVHSSASYLPLICAHSDTITPTSPESIFRDGMIMTCLTPSNDRGPVLGGDDRNGVYIMHRLAIEQPDNFIFGIFDEEESGSLGVQTAFEVIRGLLPRISCFVGLDRRGNNDLACYSSRDFIRRPLNTPAFIDLLERNTGYFRAVGASSDVSRLAAEFRLSCTNFSVGYHNEHHNCEYTVVSEVEHTLNILRTKLPPQLWSARFPF